MLRVNPYLTFNGNCREAMTFYRDCLGGELSLYPIGNSPMAADLPEAFSDFILHATLISGDFLLMASDMVEGEKLLRGNTCALLLHCTSAQEVFDYYKKLSEGGKPTNPVIHTHFGDLHGDLVDKFGNHWMLHFHATETSK